MYQVSLSRLTSALVASTKLEHGKLLGLAKRCGRVGDQHRLRAGIEHLMADASEH